MHLHHLQRVLTLCFAKVTKLLKLQLSEDDADTLKRVGVLTFFFVALRPNAGHGLFILEVSRSHTTTLHSR